MTTTATLMQTTLRRGSRLTLERMENESRGTGRVMMIYTPSTVCPKPAEATRIVCVSDFHGDTNIELPTGDILIVPGGFAPEYKFLQYLARYNYKAVVLCGGAQEDADVAKTMSHGTLMYLNAATTIVEGLRIAVCTQRTPDTVEFVAGKISGGPDVLVSALAPAGVLDKNEFGENIGSTGVRELIEELQPRVCVFSSPVDGGATYLGKTLCIGTGLYHYDRDVGMIIRYNLPLIVDLF